MKHFNLWATALLISIGLSSCALSYPYCDAYSGVDFEQTEASTDVMVEAEVQP